MKKRRICSVLVAAVLLFTTMGRAFASEMKESTFFDMPDNWAKTTLEKAVENGPWYAPEMAKALAMGTFAKDTSIGPEDVIGSQQ